MLQARYELRKRRQGSEDRPDAVPSEPDFKDIYLEYNYYLLGRAADLIGIWMSLLRSALFALIFYSRPSSRSCCPFRSACSGRARSGPWRTAGPAPIASARGACSASGAGSRGSPPAGPALVAVKTRRCKETLEIMLLKEPAVVLKRELADLPLWGWVVRRYGVIPVDRAGAGAARHDARGRGGNRRRPWLIAIYPEGTRGPGRAAAAPAGLCRPLPRACCRWCRSRWTAAASGRATGFVKRPGIVTFRFGEPIPPGPPRGEIEAAVHAAINAPSCRR